MRVLILRNQDSDRAIDASLLLSTYFQTQGIGFSVADTDKAEGVSAEGLDLVVALGGDGTILRAAHIVGDAGLAVPVLGLGYGHLGFLANDTDESVVRIVAAALSGDVTSEERANLRVSVLCEGDDEDAFDAACADEPDYGSGRCFFALNEAALTRGASGRIVEMKLSVAGADVNELYGDGVVVSSATGSTAYALSAGGPLVAPEFRGLIVVPVAPHSLVSRAVLTNPNDVVEIEMGDRSADAEAELFIDGFSERFDAPIKRLRVQRGPVPTVLYRYDYEGFYKRVSKVFFSSERER